MQKREVYGFNLDPKTSQLIDLIVNANPEYANRSHAIIMIVREKAREMGVFFTNDYDKSSTLDDESRITA